jgi:hypothetical protein
MLVQLVAFVVFATIYSFGFFAFVAGLRRKEFAGVNDRFCNLALGFMILFMAVGGYWRVHN